MTHTVLKKIYSQKFTDHLNSVDDDIKWTMESKVELRAQLEGSTRIGEEETSVRVARALAFLDTWMVVKSDGSISTKVFRKDTHTDQCLNFDSNHPLEHKKGVVRTLMNRADRLVSDETELQREKDHTRKALQVNGYLITVPNMNKSNDSFQKQNTSSPYCG